MSFLISRVANALGGSWLGNRQERTPEELPQFPVFLSFRVLEAEQQALALKAVLQRHGYATLCSSCDFKRGADWIRGISTALSACGLVVVLATRTYAGEGTDAFATGEELAVARQLKKPLYVIPMTDRLEDPAACVMLGRVQRGVPWTTRPSRVPQPLLDDLLAVCSDLGLTRDPSTAQHHWSKEGGKQQQQQQQQQQQAGEGLQEPSTHSTRKQQAASEPAEESHEQDPSAHKPQMKHMEYKSTGSRKASAGREAQHALAELRAQGINTDLISGGPIDLQNMLTAFPKGRRIFNMSGSAQNASMTGKPFEPPDGSTIKDGTLLLYGTAYVKITANVRLQDVVLKGMGEQQVVVVVVQGGRLELERCTVEGGQRKGAAVHVVGSKGGLESGSESILSATQTHVHSKGKGLFVRHGTATLERCSASACGSYGVEVEGSGSTLHAQHCTVDDNAATNIWVAKGAQAHLEYTTSNGSKDCGWAVHGHGTALTAIDCQTNRNGRTGCSGLSVTSGATITLVRCTSNNNGEEGWWATDKHTHLVVEDSQAVSNMKRWANKGGKKQNAAAVNGACILGTCDLGGQVLGKGEGVSESEDSDSEESEKDGESEKEGESKKEGVSEIDDWSEVSRSELSMGCNAAAPYQRIA